MVTVLPVADGGDGTLDVAAAAGFRTVTIAAADPLGQPSTARIALRDDVAVVELAEVCGLQRLPADERHPDRCTSLGLGLAVRAALGLGVREVLVGLGGRASTDGGAGVLCGLGARLLDRDGRDVPPVPSRLAEVVRMDLSGLDGRLAGARVTVASDVSAPLLGPSGAAVVFGPQKGADADSVARLEKALQAWSRTLQAVIGRADPDAEGAGAAGGVGYALQALGATFRNGARLCLDLVRFGDHIANADLVVTGEGRMDRQTLLGKLPAIVAAEAMRVGVPTVAVVGSLADDIGPAELRQLGISDVHQLVDEDPQVVTSVPATRAALHAIGRRIAGLLEGPGLPSG
jgi:glycerate kinase